MSFYGSLKPIEQTKPAYLMHPTLYLKTDLINDCLLFCNYKSSYSHIHIETCYSGQTESVFWGHGNSYLAQNKLLCSFWVKSCVFFFKSTVLEPEHVTPRTIYLYCRSYLNWCQVPAWSLCTPLSILSDWVRIDEFFQDLTLHLIWLIFYWFILSLLLNIWILFYLCQSIQLGQLFSFVFMAFVCW